MSEFPPSKTTNKGQWCRACHREKVCGPATERACDWCGEIRTVTARRSAEKNVYCSRACKDKAQTAADALVREQSKRDRRCVHCGGAMPHRMRIDAKFCSEDCNSAAHKLKRAHGRLSRGSGRRRDIQRAYIIERDSGRCHLCGKICDPSEIHLDHLVPVSLGGSHDESNLRVACVRCNTSKRNRAMNEQLMLVG